MKAAIKVRLIFELYQQRLPSQVFGILNDFFRILGGGMTITKCIDWFQKILRGNEHLNLKTLLPGSNLKVNSVLCCRY